MAMAARYDVAPMHVQQLMEQQVQEELRKSAKRAANRRSASTCRARKKFLVETMAEANERMRKRSRVLSLLPDMILAMRRDGVVTYASENCRQFLKYNREVSHMETATGDECEITQRSSSTSTDHSCTRQASGF